MYVCFFFQVKSTSLRFGVSTSLWSLILVKSTFNCFISDKSALNLRLPFDVK